VTAAQKSDGRPAGNRTDHTSLRTLRSVQQAAVKSPTITGIVTVDISRCGRYDYDEIHRRLWVIEDAPAGVTVQITVGDIAPWPPMYKGIRYGHVNIVVSGPDPGPWVRALRGEPEPESGVWSPIGPYEPWVAS
jgi:hypothetical protein